MGTKIGKEKIQREKGYLYFIGKDGYVWAAPMKHNKSGKKKKVGTEKIAKEKGFMYLHWQRRIRRKSQDEERIISLFPFARSLTAARSNPAAGLLIVFNSRQSFSIVLSILNLVCRKNSMWDECMIHPLFM